jgi:Pyrimidine dimer DNA glycosylase
VQTFLPYPDFARTAEVLDDRRLGKQRVEVLQILNAMHRTSGGWINHPATRMWRGYEPALIAYGLAIIGVWTWKGRVDTVRGKILPHLHGEPVRTQRELEALGMLPPWPAARTCTAPIARRWSARCPSTTDRCSPTSRTTCRTSGRRESDRVGVRSVRRWA